mmetsp:Transcript_10121/g.20358  ORF Transcript_10121/g.20358 Transcript_10121/m.20358 type:complete len:462 (-) Transcript_10121:51-1436(-)
MISALKIAGSVYFFFLPAVGSFAPAAVRINAHNQLHGIITAGKTVHHPHHLLCALPVPGDMSASFNGKFRNDNSNNASTTKPRLASAIENILQWLIKHVLLSQYSSLKVNMNAVSNKAILKGNISKISVSARDCIFRFKLVSFRKLDLYGVNLHLGYLPFLLPVLPLFLWRLRRYIQSTIITVFLLRITGCLDADNFRRQLGSIKGRIRRYIGSPRQPCISYSMAITSSDIGNSLLLRFWLRNILQSLVQNSVVGAAAAFGDAAQQSMEAERRRMQNGTPLLPGSAAELPNLSSQDQQQQQGLTSALLSATSFELTNAGFMDGKVVFDAKAILPRDENGVSNSLQFRIRAKLAPTAISETVSQTIQQQDAQEVYNALGFLQPECRLATNPLYAPIGGNLLRNLLPNLIPEYLWLPFGVGVAVPLGRGCEIYRAEIDACKEGGFLCKIDGSVNVVNSSSNIQ